MKLYTNSFLIVIRWTNIINTVYTPTRGVVLPQGDETAKEKDEPDWDDLPF